MKMVVISLIVNQFCWLCFVAIGEAVRDEDPWRLYTRLLMRDTRDMILPKISP